MATLLSTDPVTGVETYTGFSWTTLFFGPIPALARRDWLGVAIGVGLLVVLFVGVSVVVEVTGSLGMAQLLSAGVWMIWAALYNANHAARAGG